MSSSVFQIKEHTLECQHVREYPHATAGAQEDVLYLAIKQYIPLDNLHPQDGDVTIIGAHANGFPKELYEPLWEELHARSKSNGFRIRSIWIADAAHQGVSGVLNEMSLGNDPSWNDLSRDLLHMVNHFRAEMPMPLAGIGHSFGGCVLTNLALMHPRLLSTLVLLDPVIHNKGYSPGAADPTTQSTFRRDLWPSRAEAEAAFRKQKFYQSWDPRVLDRWIKFGIRQTPTTLYPTEHGPLTLTTTKHQECFTYLRPTWPAMSEDGSQIIKPELVPELRTASPMNNSFYRPEPSVVAEKLGEVRPSVLYIFGAKSYLSSPEFRQFKMENTGTARGGSGGAKEGRVKEVLLNGVGHLVAMEATVRCADAVAPWLGQEVKRFQEERRDYLEWSKKSLVEKSTMSREWQKRIGDTRPRGKI